MRCGLASVSSPADVADDDELPSPATMRRDPRRGVGRSELLMDLARDDSFDNLRDAANSLCGVRPSLVPGEVDSVAVDDEGVAILAALDVRLGPPRFVGGGTEGSLEFESCPSPRRRERAARFLRRRASFPSLNDDSPEKVEPSSSSSSSAPKRSDRLFLRLNEVCLHFLFLRGSRLRERSDPHSALSSEKDSSSSSSSPSACLVDVRALLLRVFVVFVDFCGSNCSSRGRSRSWSVPEESSLGGSL